MKTRQRLDYNRLAEALGERGLVEPQTLQHILNQCLSGSGLFTEILVRENHVSDWELSRVVCEVFGLPFLPTAVYTPSAEAAEGIDIAFLHEYAIVPLDRFGKLLTVAMPGLVPSQVLVQLGELVEAEVLPVVGSVESNRRWLQAELPLPNALTALGGADEEAPEVGHAGVGDFAVSADALTNLEEDWGDLFDEGDAAVLLGLDGEPAEPGQEAAADTGDLPIPQMPELDDIPNLTELAEAGDEQEIEDEKSEASAPSIDLPDLPRLPEE